MHLCESVELLPFLRCHWWYYQEDDVLKFSTLLEDLYLFYFQIIDDILARNHLPVIVGGTNYYIQVGILNHASCILCISLCSSFYLFKFLLMSNNVLMWLSSTFVLGAFLLLFLLQALVSPFLLDDSAEDMDESCLGDPTGTLLCIWWFILLFLFCFCSINVYLAFIVFVNL